MLSVVQWTKTRGPRLTSNWSMWALRSRHAHKTVQVVRYSDVHRPVAAARELASRTENENFKYLTFVSCECQTGSLQTRDTISADTGSYLVPCLQTRDRISCPVCRHGIISRALSADTGSRLTRTTYKCNTLSGILYRPDNDPVKGRNIVAKYQIYLYLEKSYVTRHYTDT
jgi:hypothetical protein